MKPPRAVSGRELVRALSAYGYQQTRQTGSHMRLTTAKEGTHHVTVPAHGQLRPGTLSAIVSDVASHLGLDRKTVLERLFGKAS